MKRRHGRRQRDKLGEFGLIQKRNDHVAEQTVDSINISQFELSVFNY